MERSEAEWAASQARIEERLNMLEGAMMVQDMVLAAVEQRLLSGEYTQGEYDDNVRAVRAAVARRMGEDLLAHIAQHGN